ncbi:FKBP-type peptidylprolyl isomerase [Nitzschia inconspicua]|uniref:peptidylprolyl isomerase n=1 Tax=Nitzschia inconspicua TaxID=303405 RepID=A0A9K3KY12_9STRA|nr:FKBP-type peptidylprolyl isomerase [Nitzschia inconspicua]
MTVSVASRVFQSLLVGLWFLFLEVSAGTNEAGLAFLAANKEKDGVVTLPSGLQYKVLQKGRGPAHPTIDSPCSCHYEGKLIDGTVFDSSYERGQPTTFAPNQVIKGWTEAMQLMVAGDKWELYIPSELGYGDRGSPPKIQGGDVLIFQMEMLAIQGDTVPALSCSVTDPKKDCTDREQTYIDKVKKWTVTEANKPAKELKRIQAILATPMTEELRDWAKRRAHILSQFTEGDTKTTEEL